MEINQYDIGDSVYPRVIFTVNDVVTDPVTVTAVVTEPDGTEHEYEYNAGPDNIIRNGPGDYSLRSDATAAGYWRTRWTGTSADGDAVVPRTHGVRRTLA